MFGLIQFKSSPKVTQKGESARKARHQNDGPDTIEAWDTMQQHASRCNSICCIFLCDCLADLGSRLDLKFHRSLVQCPGITLDLIGLYKSSQSSREISCSKIRMGGSVIT